MTTSTNVITLPTAYDAVAETAHEYSGNRASTCVAQNDKDMLWGRVDEALKILDTSIQANNTALHAAADQLTNLVRPPYTGNDLEKTVQRREESSEDVGFNLGAREENNRIKAVLVKFLEPIITKLRELAPKTAPA